VGTERLILGFAIAALAAGCGGAPAARPEQGSGGPRHAQIVRAMTTSERRALVDRFVARNPGWFVSDAALGGVTVVDPFAGFLRRARAAPHAAGAGAPITSENAALAARGFVKKNAELFGIPHYVALSLVDHVRAVAPEDHASARAVFAVRLEAPFAMKGYEAFHEVENVADVEVFVDDDGTPSGVANVSKIHPRLAIDTHPTLAEDDAALYKNVLGRRVFALGDDDAKIELGVVEAKDLLGSKLYIHESPGPMLAWITYRLARVITVAKAAPEMPVFYFFAWVVDADTGDVIRETEVPNAPMLGPPGSP
jgi:hypothetical protein